MKTMASDSTNDPEKSGHASGVDHLYLREILNGDDQAWQRLINHYEGRLIAFAAARLNDRNVADDVVQETFIGFYRSLPNFDFARPLEAYLYQICSFKITDHLRRNGKRKALPLHFTNNDQQSDTAIEISSRSIAASSIARGNERKRLEQEAIDTVLREQVLKWKSTGDFQKLKCLELLFVSGLTNKDVAQSLQLSEQQVANFKADFLGRTRTLLSRLALSPDVFPELFQ